MKKRQILINAGMSVIQVIVLGGMVFFLYRFLLRSIGPEKLGVWSLVLASTSVSHIANLGLGGSVVKFVAKYAARNDYEAISRLLQTTLLTVSTLLGLVLLLSYPFATYLLAFLINDSSMPEALSILPFAMASVWLAAITSILNAGLDGLQRSDLRSGLLIAATAVYTILCVLLVGRYGLMGLAYANVLQYLALLGGSYTVLRKHVLLPILPNKWDKLLFREMLGYGTNFQVITIANMLSDPVTKSLLARFGGLTTVGYYEMASKMVMQFRSIIGVANHVLVPAIADLTEKAAEQVKGVYLDSYRVSFFVAVPLFTLIAVLTPIISVIWIGYYEPSFITFTLFLTAGWFLNLLTAPAYITYLGKGRLRWNTLSHVSIAILNLSLGWVLGSFYGAVGVVIGWVLALAIGSLVSPVAYHVEQQCPFLALLPLENLLVVAASLLVGLLTALLYIYLGKDLSLPWQAVSIATGFTLIMFFPLWKHSVRKRLRLWLKTMSLQSNQA